MLIENHEQLMEALAKRKEIDDATAEYSKKKAVEFKAKIDSGHIWKAEDLRFAKSSRCPCGAGLAYPKECGAHHYWDCSNILMGIADATVKHCAKYPFVFYDIKSEDEGMSPGTTRP